MLVMPDLNLVLVDGLGIGLCGEACLLLLLAELSFGETPMLLLLVGGLKYDTT